MQPTQYFIDGAKFELTSAHNQNFQTSHGFEWGTAQTPSTYNFAAAFAKESYMLHGTVDPNGTVMARANYNWNPSPAAANPDFEHEEVVGKKSSVSKLQAQLSSHPGKSVIVLEHEHNGQDFSLTGKMANVNFFDSAPSNAPGTSSITGNFNVAYLQSLTKNLAVGADYNYQRPYPDVRDSAFTFGIRYAPDPVELQLPISIPPGTQSPYMPVNPEDPTEIYAMTFTPHNGLLVGSYWRRVNQRLEIGTDLQMLLQPSTSTNFGQRNGHVLLI
jgi:mitochondrial import receptor subunit TOM40